MTRVDLLTLAKAIEADLAAASSHRALALEFVGKIETAGATTVVAASLHHYYSAIEALVERAMRAFGHSLPSGARWHVELLELAALEVEGVRPALFGPTAGTALLELLAFRHFFRHAYAVSWDPVRLTKNCHVMASAAEAIDADISRFVATLRAAAE